MLEIIGTCVGLVYLWLELRASIYLWIAGIVMPAIYIFVYYEAGLYADFGINVYYLLAAFYGLLLWKKARNTKTAISHTPRRLWLRLAVLAIILFASIAFILIRFTDSTVPYPDSFITALSIVALWMLARKYIEQWLVWAAVDLVCTVLYIYKDLPFTAALYGLYTVVAIYGYRRWQHLMTPP